MVSHQPFGERIKVQSKGNVTFSSCLLIRWEHTWTAFSGCICVRMSVCVCVKKKKTRFFAHDVNGTRRAMRKISLRLEKRELKPSKKVLFPSSEEVCKRRSRESKRLCLIEKRARIYLLFFSFLSFSFLPSRALFI